MLVEKIIGNVTHDINHENKGIEWVPLDWYDAHKKIHRFTLEDGTDLGVRLSAEDAVIGLSQGDILLETPEKWIAVEIKACLCIGIKRDDPDKIMKACYEIGNRHAPLYHAEDDYFITPYEKTLFELFVSLDFHPIAQEFKICANRNISNHGNLTHSGGTHLH